MKHWLIAGVIVSLAPAAGVAAGLSGPWKIDGNFSDLVKYTVTCDFTPENDKFAGPCKDDHGQSFRATGSVEGDKTEIAYDTTYEGTPVHLDYKGDVQGDGSLKGGVDAGIAQGAFTAVKQ